MRESDWKLFRDLRLIALNRFCERVLGEIPSIAHDKARTPHEQYLAVFEFVRRKDRDLAERFDNPRRSTALHQLRLIRSEGLITDEEFARFSLETCDAVGEDRSI